MYLLLLFYILFSIFFSFLIFYIFYIEFDYTVLYLFFCTLVDLNQNIYLNEFKYANIFDIIIINIKSFFLLIYCIFNFWYINILFKLNIFLIALKNYLYIKKIFNYFIFCYFITIYYYYFYFSKLLFKLLLNYQINLNNNFILKFELFFTEYFEFWKILFYFYLIIICIYILHLILYTKLISYNLFNKLLYCYCVCCIFLFIGNFFFINLNIFVVFFFFCLCLYFIFNIIFFWTRYMYILN